ncbi:hypothetical protein FQN57_006078 [Myotisia sp. PD_48]|nr:hypothetical protein FQN57_006078 [Myotisia sp. PD_48]
MVLLVSPALSYDIQSPTLKILHAGTDPIPGFGTGMSFLLSGVSPVKGDIKDFVKYGLDGIEDGIRDFVISTPVGAEFAPVVCVAHDTPPDGGTVNTAVEITRNGLVFNINDSRTALPNFHAYRASHPETNLTNYFHVMIPHNETEAAPLVQKIIKHAVYEGGLIGDLNLTNNTWMVFPGGIESGKGAYILGNDAQRPIRLLTGTLGVDIGADNFVLVPSSRDYVFTGILSSDWANITLTVTGPPNVTVPSFSTMTYVGTDII